MRGPNKEPDEPLLFDLPLEIPERKRASGAPAERKRADRREHLESRLEPEAEALSLPILNEAPPPLRIAPAPAGMPRPESEDATPAATGDGRATVGSRVAAGGADLLVHAAVAVGLLLGTRAMGVRPSLEEWPAVALFLVAFSFLYAVVPLAFWGHTLGMAWAGLTSRNRDGEPLTFDQTTRRWLGALLTLLTLGIPLLLARRGRSLADQISGSDTYLAGA